MFDDALKKKGVSDQTKAKQSIPSWKREEEKNRVKKQKGSEFDSGFENDFAERGRKHVFQIKIAFLMNTTNKDKFEAKNQLGFGS